MNEMRLHSSACIVMFFFHNLYLIAIKFKFLICLSFQFGKHIKPLDVLSSSPQN